MTHIHSSLKKGAQIAAAAAVVGIISTSSAMALVGCGGQGVAGWRPFFNNLPLDCNADQGGPFDPDGDCAILDAMELCCTNGSGSTGPERKACVSPICVANEQAMIDLGITNTAGCYP